ncbi:hypothetical protein [Nocardia sp. NPDC050793]
MNVALCMMVYGSTVAAFGPPVLHRLTHRGVFGILFCGTMIS